MMDTVVIPISVEATDFLSAWSDSECPFCGEKLTIIWRFALGVAGMPSCFELFECACCGATSDWSYGSTW
jgi:hypothetical protein